MARPTEEVVLWAAQDVTLPALAGPNKVLPISDLINKGWDMNQKPAADEFNYLLNNYAKWLIYLDEKSGGASPDAPEVDSFPSTTPLRDTDGKGCFKGIKASNTTNANAFNMIDTYNSKTSVSVSIDGNEIGNFVFNGLLASGDGRSGLACNTAGIHYGNVVGNADTATAATTADKWKTTRTITFNGDVEGFMLLDGTSNVGCNLTVTSGLNYSDLFTGSVSTKSVYVGQGFTNDTAGIIHVYLRDGTGPLGCGTLTASLLAYIPSGQLQIDITDGPDFTINYNYDSVTGMLTITNGGKGTIIKIGKHY